MTLSFAALGRSKFPAMALVAIVVLASAATCAHAQQPMNKSEIVRINDPQQAFFETVNECHEAFTKVAEKSPAFLDAEETAKRLAEDPDNIALKREMIKDRTKVVYEKMNLLRNATHYRDQLDSNFENFKQQLDAEIVDANNAITQKKEEEGEEARFLSASIEQLKMFEEYLPQLGDGNPSDVPLSEEEKQMLLDFKHALEIAETKMELAKDNSNLQTRRVAVLAEIRIRASKEYMAIRTAMAHARSDQIVFAGIAENDLTYLDVLEDEERLNAMLGRQPVQYQRQSGSFAFRGGYQFGEINQPSDRGITVPSSQDDIDRIEEKLNRRGDLRNPEVATNSKERSDRK